MKECNDFLELQFNENNENYKTLQKNILLESKEEKNKFFFNEFNSDAWKMIMSLISSNISNTSIFQILYEKFLCDKKRVEKI